MSAPLPHGLPAELGDVAQLLGKLPGIGGSSSVKLATLLAQNPELSLDIESALHALRIVASACPRCNFIARRGGLCFYCQDRKRDDRLLCVVERVRDVTALEKAGTWRGRYFVLGKLISPLEDIGEAELPMKDLFARCWDLARHNGGGEVLLALPSTTDGDATSLLIAARIRVELPEGVRPKISSLARGVADRADLSYADPITLGQALAGRSSIGGGG